MGVSFLSPVGFLVALAGALPLLGLAVLERRAERLRRLLRVDAPDRRRRLELAGALAAVALLLGLAAAQPVLAVTHEKTARSDAEVLFVIDVSRSMQASSGEVGATRLERARTLAMRVRAALGDIPAGVASMTDRTLPYLFPTANTSVFNATVERAVQIESPPPASRVGNPGGRATTLGALTSIATKNYFTPGTTHRLMIALSDDESEPFAEAGIGAVFRKPPRLRTIFVRFWAGDERIYADGHRDRVYRPDPASARIVQSLALATRGRAFEEQQLAEIIHTARVDLGTGAVHRNRLERARTPIAAWLAAAALVPLGLVLRRRNF
jgi:hypothetical protein